MIISPEMAVPLQEGRPVRAALLLPLSGPSAGVGTAMLNAAQLALFDTAPENFTLLPLDTRGTPDGAAAAARHAVSEGVDVILGPLFSGDVKATGPIARQANLNVVSFSTDRTAASQGVFVLGFLPGPQVERVVSYARSQGMSRFGALLPNTEYGRAVSQAMQETLRRGGGTLVATEFYDPNANDLGQPVRAIAAQADSLDAILLPDEGLRLRALASQLAVAGVDTTRVKLLGTMLWDDPRLGQEPALVGAWYPLPPSAQFMEFQSRYAQSFGSRPPRIASLAYDATALAAVLARRPNPDFSTASLTNPSGFAGIDGIFRLLPNGTAERGFAVLEVTRAGPREISPAPQTFERPVF